MHTGLKELGVDSKVFSNSKLTLGDDSVVSTIQTTKGKASNMIRGQLDDALTLFYPKRKGIIFSTGIFGLDLTKIKEYHEADIIHLHWINAGFINIKHLKKIDKPIVWTIRDMWPMTGGCHYSMGCEEYKIACGKCEQLGSNSAYDLSKVILNRKKKYLPKNIQIVGISNWLSAEAKKSVLFKNLDVITISNNINTEAFFPVNKTTAKKNLSINTNKKIILVGSTNLKDHYKGFGKYLEAISTLDNDKYFLAFFGNLDKEIADSLGFQYKYFGYLHDNISLRLVYSCANVFVAPSLMEGFGKTLAESMACGTPVVCFDATGPKDIVTHKVDGYKSKAFESYDLANGIEWVLNAKNYDELCKNSRKKVLTQFESVVVAKKYIALYEDILR